MECRVATRRACVLALAVSFGWGLAEQALAQTRPDTAAAGMGQATYRSYCASCHGKKGKGDGALAEHLRVPPTDLTTISQQNGGVFPFDRIVKVIDGRTVVRAHGSPDMPVWGDAFLNTGSIGSEEKVTAKMKELAHFIWSIQEKAPPPTSEPAEPPAPTPEAAEPPAPTPESSPPPQG